MSEIRKIENFAAPELDVYARLSEPQLLHYYEPQPGLFLAESPRVIERALDAGYEPVSFLAGSAELAANEALFAHCPNAPACTPGDEATMIFDRTCEIRRNFDHELVKKLVETEYNPMTPVVEDEEEDAFFIH